MVTLNLLAIYLFRKLVGVRSEELLKAILQRAAFLSQPLFNESAHASKLLL